MLREYFVEAYNGKIWVTDEPGLAKELMKNGPVIGYVGKEMDRLDHWSGLFYLIMDWEAITPHYLELVWCRYYQIPLIIARTKEWSIREMKEEDAPYLCQFYGEKGEWRIPDTHGERNKNKNRTEWVLAERLRIAAYRKNVYPVRGYGMYVLEKENHPIGLAGFEMEEIAGESRITMGYYVIPEERRKGVAKKACEMLLNYVEEEYGVDQVYLRIHKKNLASISLAKQLGFELWMPDPIICSDLLFRIPPAWK